jgi:citrate synthase
MIEEVERIGDARKYVKELLDKGERLMGFGHRVYRAQDPRSRTLRRTCEELGAPRYQVAKALEEAALAELRERRPDRVLETNVEFWAAVLLVYADVYLCAHCRLVCSYLGTEAHWSINSSIVSLYW